MFDANMLLDNLDNNQQSVSLSQSHFPLCSHNAGCSTGTFWGLVLLAGGIFWRKYLSKNFLDGGSLEGLPTDEGGSTCV